MGNFTSDALDRTQVFQEQPTVVHGRDDLYITFGSAIAR